MSNRASPGDRPAASAPSPERAPRPPSRGPFEVLPAIDLGGGRVIVRTSGTEPKLKCYLDAVSTDGTAAERIAAATATVATAVTETTPFIALPRFTKSRAAWAVVCAVVLESGPAAASA